MTQSKLNKWEQTLQDSYPIERINPHSKDEQHHVDILLPKRLYPDFIVPKNGNFIEYKGFVRDKQWFDCLKYMSNEDRERYKVVLGNPNNKTPWAHIDYGTWCTMCGIKWSKYPNAPTEWFE